MQIEIKIDETLSEPRIIIMTNKITDEISELMQRLAEEKPRLLAGFKKETVSLLEQEKIIRIYAANSKVFAVTEDDEYQVRLRLYELEDRLDRKFFVRISNSEIINLRKIEEFDMSFTRYDLRIPVKWRGYLCFTALHRQNQTIIRIMRWSI